MEITVYGKATAGQQVIIDTLNKFLTKANITYNINEVTDVNVFIEKSIMRVPALQVNGGKITSLGKNGEMVSSLRQIVTNILAKNKFGTMKKFLIPIDFSDTSSNAFIFGHRLATHMDAGVKAIHVFFPSSVDFNASAVTDVDVVEMRKSIFNEFIDEVDVDWAGDVLKAALIERDFRTGFPGDEIIEAADDESCSLILMGTHGENDLLKQLFGSVTTKVINEASCPIMVIPENAKYQGIHDILFAFDDVSKHYSEVEQLISFAERNQSKIHLIHVLEEDDSGIEPYELLERIKEKYPKDKVTLTEVKAEDPAKAIDAYASENDIDLIAMITHHRNLFERLFHHSVTKDMAIHSSIPLLILKSKD